MKDVKRKFVCTNHTLQLHRIKIASNNVAFVIFLILQNRQVTLHQTFRYHIKGYVYCNILKYIKISLHNLASHMRYLSSKNGTSCIFKCINILRTLPNRRIWYFQYIMHWLQTRKTMLSMKNCFTNLSANRPCNNIVNCFYTLWRYYMTKRW